MPGEVGTPTEPLYRLGRRGVALDWPSWDWVGDGRFDDPRRIPKYRVLYVGDRRACFFEKLVPYPPVRAGIVPPFDYYSWVEGRRIVRFRLHDPGSRWRWLDLGSPVTFGELQVRFGAQLEAFGYQQFDLAVATSSERALTQPIALWAYRRGYHGIVYRTRHDPDLRCWAIFSVFGAAEFVDVEESSIATDDEDLRAVVDAWNLTLPAP